jgi:hypothetical protein
MDALKSDPLSLLYILTSAMRVGIFRGALIQFPGGSALVRIATESLNSILSTESNEQQAINAFTDTRANSMLEHNREGQAPANLAQPLFQTGVWPSTQYTQYT